MEDIKVKEERSAPQDTPAEAVITVSHLSKSFGDKQVLKDINLTLKKGENIVVMGKSGEGKSITIQCIVGMQEPDSGSVKVLGKEVLELNDEELKELRKRIGFLFQSAALYDSMSVRDNLSFPLTKVLKIKDQKEIDQRIEEMLDSVGLSDAIDKMPSDLSGGMLKRVGLARTLIVKPEIMLYDEPTTGLDPITGREISHLIVDIQKKYKTSSIIITHDLECAKITANRILVMSEGEYIAEGTYDELQSSDNELVKSFFI
ncbi:ABC transporter ATP-binding protein [Pedobacter sp. L105]|uniref:ABC transporter ATP-binding protein n=1 Tax=Pedobacter sp. L105 TaxID=1641871 RepID=UPI00131B74F8|nr:ATP-binding cassette domain-containing protein [Pedobacter sp. L105]